jgi:hypothetical protein
MGRAFGRVLHQLWLEVTGLIFLVMGWVRARGGGNLFHGDICVVWG